MKKMIFTCALTAALLAVPFETAFAEEAVTSAAEEAVTSAAESAEAVNDDGNSGYL